MAKKRKHFKCKSETQKKAIKIAYAKKSQQQAVENKQKEFPDKFPFWARLKISKNRTTLVIDEALAKNKKTKKMEDGFVHREAIHPHGDGSNVKGYEKIEPNPDPTDNDPMYLKRPTKLPKRLFQPHNKKLNMPDDLRERYDKNNKKE